MLGRGPVLLGVEEAAPEPRRMSDAELKAKIEESILQLGIHTVTVAVTDLKVTLTGTAPKDKLATIMKAAMEADATRVNNLLRVY
jgi:hypothetical protein